MHNESPMLTTIVLAVGCGLIAQVLAQRWRIPAIVLLLIFGVAAGPDGLGLLEPAALGESLAVIIKLAVAIILFEGSLNLRISVLRSAATEVRNLITLGAVITWALTAVTAHYIANLEWPLAILFGALLTVTGPTVVHPLLKRISVNRRIKTILEGEAILIDPVGAILAVAVVDVILSRSSHQSGGLLFALWSYFGRLIVGALAGGISALVLSRILKIRNFVPSELSNLVVLAGVWASFGLAEELYAEAGIMAAVAMGLVMQHEAVPGERQLRHFKETLTTLSIGTLFILLAASLRIQVVQNEGIRGVLTIAAIMFLIRPVSVLLATWNSRLTWREKILIAWIGPRGIVAASVASLFGLTLYRQGIVDGMRLPALTFLAIMMTVTIQGLTASLIAKLLKLQSLEGRRVIVVGANRLGRAVATIIREHGRPVTFIDSNLALVNDACDAGFDAVHGNAMDEDVLEDADIDETETLVATTANSEVNVLVSQFAHDVFGIKRVLPTLNSPDAGRYIKTLEHTGGGMVFGRPIDVFAWEHTIAQQFAWSVPKSWPQIPIGDIKIFNSMLPVIRLRDNSAEVVHFDQVWKPKDKIVFLACMPIDEAQKVLADQVNNQQQQTRTKRWRGRGSTSASEAE